jgi:hypothetical protein
LLRLRRRGGYAVDVFAEDARGQRSAGRREAFEARGDFFVADFERQLAIGNVEVDDVAFADGGDGAADKGFRGDVAGGEAARCAGEAAVGEQGDGAR